MKPISILSALLLPAVLFTFCSDNIDDPYLLSLRDKGVDVKIVEESDITGEQFFRYEETLSLGGEEKPKLFQPGSCLIDDDGNMYFTDEQRIKKFTPEGDFLQYIGDIGQGPGEVEYPELESITENNLIVGQGIWRGQRKYELFDLNGEYISRIYHPELKDSILPEARNYITLYLGNNRFLFEASQREVREKGMVYYEMKYGISDEGGKLLKELELVIEPYLSEVISSGSGLSRPLTLSKSPAFMQEILYILNRNGKDVCFFNNTGKFLKIIRFYLPESETIEIEKDAIIKKYEGYGNPVFNDLLDIIGIPDNKPILCNILVDETGRIWLQKGDTFWDRSYKGIGADYTYYLLNSEGEFIGEQKLPVRLSAVKDGNAYGFLTNEEGFKVFKRYKLTN
ncbi:MAG: hypothetical protein GY863_07345 [bacterium]|nr:hypothetical protein [bacterium]